MCVRVCTCVRARVRTCEFHVHACECVNEKKRMDLRLSRGEVMSGEFIRGERTSDRLPPV